MFYIWFPGFFVPCFMVLCGTLRILRYPLEKNYICSQREQTNRLYQKSLWQVGLLLLALCFMVMRSVRLMDAALQKGLLVVLVVMQLALLFGLRYYVRAEFMKPVGSVREKAFAKLNLTLEIGQKRPDGYHDLRSVMTCCEVHDTLTVEKADDITMTCDSGELPCDESNLCMKAARVFFDDSGIAGGCAITLKKVIPMQAGLGGGSADAAAVLRALRRLYAPQLSDRKLEVMAEKLGSDVPFCVRSETALCEGRGERLTLLGEMPKLWYVLVKPEEAYSTGAMYTTLDEAAGERRRMTEAMAEAVRRKNKKAVYDAVNNDFHLALPQGSSVPGLIEKLTAMHAKAATMSGSGSAVFGIYDNSYKAKAAAMLLKEQGYCTFVGKNV